MILVYPDANPLHGDPLLSKKHGQQLVDFVGRGVCRLHFSPVVAAELERSFNDNLGGQHAALVTRIKELGKRSDGSVEEVLAALASMRSNALEKANSRRRQLADTPGIVIEGWPTNSVQEVVERELARRRPFIDKENVGTIGHRDTIIWLGLVALAAAHADDTVVLVTKDKGFLDADGGLHPDLQKDLDDHGIDVSRVVILPDLYSVLNQLSEKAETDQGRAAAYAAIRQALHEYNAELAKLRWGSEFNPRDGGLEEPEIGADIPSAMESVTVSLVESQFKVVVEPEPSEDVSSFRCTYNVSISFDGFMTKSDWYSDDYVNVDLWDSDLNDHYVSVEAHRVLELIAEVSYDPEAEEAHVEDIVGSRVIGHSY